MTAIRSNLVNAFETTLTSEMGPEALSASVASLGTFTSPAWLVIEPDSPTQREYIFFDDTYGGSSFVTSTIANRYQAGSAAGSNLTHPIGAIVRSVPMAQHIEDVHDRIDTFTHANIGGLSADDHPQYSKADGTREFTGAVAGVSPILDAHLTTKSYVDGAILGGIPAGAIMPFAAAFTPSGWLLCDGQAVSRATYATLFAVLEEVYGDGDGVNTFNVPDLRGRFPMGKTASGTGSTLGGTGGTIDPTVSIAHTHTTVAHSHTINHGHANTLATASDGAHQHTVPNHSHTMAHTHTTSINHDHAVQSTGLQVIGGLVGSSSIQGLHSQTNAGSPTQAFNHEHQVDILPFSAAAVTSSASSAASTGTASGVNTGSNGAHTHSLTGGVTDHAGSSSEHTVEVDTGGSSSLTLPSAPFQVVNYIIKT